MSNANPTLNVSQMSLIDQMPDRGFNSLEKAVATFLEDNQAPLYFWHRNRSRSDYFVQGWKQNRVYSDFILTASESGEKGSESFNRVFVLETKGRHLAGVRDAEDELTDTGYKRDVFTLCSRLAKEKNGVKSCPSCAARKCDSRWWMRMDGKCA